MKAFSLVARILAVCLLLSSRDGWAVEKVIWTFTVAGFVNGAQPLPNGNVLIPDKTASRVIEVTPTRPVGGTVVWQYTLVNTPDNARQLPNGDVLIADTGNQRTIRVTQAGSVVWTHGNGATACDDVSLNFPGDVSLADNGDYLIADQSGVRVQQFDAFNTKVWQYGDPGCVGGLGANQLPAVFHAEALGNGQVAMAANGSGSFVRVVIPTPPAGGTTVWEYGTPGIAGSGPNQLRVPTRIHLLPNGNYLISDHGAHRVIEVQPTLPSGGTIVWQYGVTDVSGNAAGQLNQPYDAQRRPNGNTLIADHSNSRVIELSPLHLSLPDFALPEGVCAPVPVLTVRDAEGSAQTVDADTTVLLAPAPGVLQLFADAECAQPLSSIQLPIGQSQRAFYARGIQTGSSNLTLTATGYVPTTVSVQIGGVLGLVFQTPPQSLQREECAPNALTVQLQGDLGTAATLPIDLPLTFRSSSAGTVFFADNQCSIPIVGEVLTSGQSLITFYVRDPLRGTSTLRVDTVESVVGAAQSLFVGHPGEPYRVGWSCASTPLVFPRLIAAGLLLFLVRRRSRLRP